MTNYSELMAYVRKHRGPANEAGEDDGLSPIVVDWYAVAVLLGAIKERDAEIQRLRVLLKTCWDKGNCCYPKGVDEPREISEEDFNTS